MKGLAYLVSALLLATSAVAQSDAVPLFGDYLVLGSLFIFFIGFLIFLMVVLSILSFVFWMWMIIDCAKRDFDDRVVWIIILVLLHSIGATIYYFAVKRKYDKKQITPGRKK